MVHTHLSSAHICTRHPAQPPRRLGCCRLAAPTLPPSAQLRQLACAGPAVVALLPTATCNCTQGGSVGANGEGGAARPTRGGGRTSSATSARDDKAVSPSSLQSSRSASACASPSPGARPAPAPPPGVVGALTAPGCAPPGWVAGAGASEAGPGGDRARVHQRGADAARGAGGQRPSLRACAWVRVSSLLWFSMPVL